MILPQCWPYLYSHNNHSVAAIDICSTRKNYFLTFLFQYILFRLGTQWKSNTCNGSIFLIWLWPFFAKKINSNACDLWIPFYDHSYINTYQNIVWLWASELDRSYWPFFYFMLLEWGNSNMSYSYSASHYTRLFIFDNCLSRILFSSPKKTEIRRQNIDNVST